MNTKSLEAGDALYSGKPEASDAPSIEDLHEARLRWGTMGMAAILGCAADGKVGMKKFIELADLTQRDLVGTVAKDFYAGELGLTEDSLGTFITVTNLGITGCGFDREVLAEDTETRCVIEANKCPIVDHANLAGYQNGDIEMEDLSLWCDTYDNFESAAVSPSQGLVHSHCIGKGDKYCRIICKTLDTEEMRKDNEHIYDYTARLRKSQQEFKPDGPWAMEGKPEELVTELIRDLVKGSEETQNQIAPTLYDKKQMGADIWGRIGSASTLMAGKLRGWEEVIKGVADKQGPALQKAAGEKAQRLEIDGTSVDDAVNLHLGLIAGQSFGSYSIEKESDVRVTGSCGTCPIVEWGGEAGLSDEANHVMGWCSAARTQEAQVIASDITQTYTQCLGRGDKACSWVIEKK